MKRVLFVSNGHGEEAIAARIATEIGKIAGLACDHLALVGSGGVALGMTSVGPRRAMPSGGLIAMGHLRNIARDLKAGLALHTWAQLRFLKSVRGRYAAAVSVGDVFALMMARYARARATIFVGTAKSAYLAPYGPLEERVVDRAQAVFVRDAATMRRLQAHNVAAEDANVIADLFEPAPGETISVPFDPVLALFPGSREPAYADAVDLCRVVGELAVTHARAGAILSIAPGLDLERFAEGLEKDGWNVRKRETQTQEPFSLYHAHREIVRAWTGSIGAALVHASLVLGQAGTANEAAAAGGVPVVALAREPARRHSWYRMRQAALLGDALCVVPGDDAAQSARAVADLLADRLHLERMRAAGLDRMGPPGAARRIAERIVRLCVPS